MWIPVWKSDLNMAPQVMDGDSDSFSSQCIAYCLCGFWGSTCGSKKCIIYSFLAPNMRLAKGTVNLCYAIFWIYRNHP